jgi:uncharacterized OsmC-like protein
MNTTSSVVEIIIWCTPILLAVLGFIGALAVNALIKMGKDINEIKVTIKEIDTKHSGLEKRVERIEEHIYQ